MPATSPRSLPVDVKAFNDLIAGKILESLRIKSSDLKVDPSLIFIDIAGGIETSSKLLPFPNRILVPIESDKSVVYQAVGALYKRTVNQVDLYMFRIVTRHSRLFGASYVMLDLSFDDQYDLNKCS